MENKFVALLIEQNNKGDYCKLINRTCQEGYCMNCEQWRNRNGK